MTGFQFFLGDRNVNQLRKFFRSTYKFNWFILSITLWIFITDHNMSVLFKFFPTLSFVCLEMHPAGIYFFIKILKNSLTGQSPYKLLKYDI